MDKLTPDAIRPIHGWGDLGLNLKRARAVRDRDAAIYTPNAFVQEGTWRPREYTQDEASNAVMDRHHLMFELARALETIEQLTPKVITLWTEADCLPEGTIVVEANGEIATIHHEGGEHYWYSPGDENHYRSTRLSYPIKVVPLPTGAWVEADEAEEAAKELDGP